MQADLEKALPLLLTNRFREISMVNVPEFKAKSKGISSLVVGKDIIIENRKVMSEVFENLKVDDFRSINSQFYGCAFKDMKIKDICFGSGLSQSVYHDCTFENFDFFSSVAGIALFENCVFVGVDARQFICKEVEFINCKFSGRFRKVLFSGSISTAKNQRKRNRFINNDLSNVSFEDFGFRGGVDLENQKLPPNNDFIYVKQGREFLDFKKSEVIKVSDSRLKDEVDTIIGIYMYKVNEGQDQLYTSINSVPKNLKNAFNWLFSEYLQKGFLA